MTAKPENPKAYPRAIRSFPGNHPTIDTPDDFDSTQLMAIHPGPNRWHLYQLSHSDDSGGGAQRWYNMKMVAEHRAPRKANFWMSYTPTADRFGPLRDTALASRYIPGILDWIRFVIAQIDADRACEPAPNPAPYSRAYAVSIGDRAATSCRVTGQVDLTGMIMSEVNPPKAQGTTRNLAKSKKLGASRKREEPTLAETDLARKLFS